MSLKKIKIKKESEDVQTEKAQKIQKKKEAAQEKLNNRSIAVQLTGERLLAQLMGNIFFDIAYIILLASIFWFNAEMTVNGSVERFTGFRISFPEHWRTLYDYFSSAVLYIQIAGRAERQFSALNYVRFLYITLPVIITIQIIFFLISCVAVPIKINRKLKPLYTMTEATRALKNVDLTSEEFSTLQDAINKFSPDNADREFHTGRKEFLGMEDAINDLLARMRTSYQSQIRFVSDASHELRTPIAVIQGYANMLDRWGREDKEILDESIASIKSEAENMNRLVENLLFLARGDSGRTVLRLENININELLCDIYDEFVMIDTEHEFILDLRADITAQADISLIKQCLRILVDNAVKYSPNKTDIILRLQKHDEETFSIDVQDYGMGIKKDDADKIFERFYRSDPARTRANGGSGLGLSIAKWIADKHHGYFDVLSYENLGTRISLILPYVVDSEEKNNNINNSENSNEEEDSEKIQEST